MAEKLRYKTAWTGGGIRRRLARLGLAAGGAELRNPLAPIRSAADRFGAVRAGGCGGVIAVQSLPKHEGGLAPEVPVPIWTWKQKGDRHLRSDRGPASPRR